MKRFLIFFLITSWISGFSQTPLIKGNHRIFKLPANIKTTDYLPNTIIVKYKAAIAPINSQGSNSLAANPKFSLKSANVIAVSNKFPSATNATQLSANPITQTNAGSSINQTVAPDLSTIYEIKYSGSTKIEDVINELLQDQSVVYAEPSYINHTFYSPNDPSYINGGQSYLNQVKAPQAWDIIKNSSSVVIAIVDNGSDLTHPDLANNIYINTADPINGVDDDHDGYIDNYRGWDLAGASTSNPQGDNDPGVKSLSGSHGVHLSGLASAVSDNNTGIASIAFNAKLLIVKAAADDNPNLISLGYEGIKYAADHGAQIINCSWGSTTGGQFGQDIIDYAISKNCLVVAAAGNSGNTDVEYPAAYNGVLAVANVEGNDVVASSSNYGNQVGISAPGTNIYSTLYPNTYGTLSGTSMSAPLVSSAAALVKAYFPALTMQQVGEKVRVTADYIDDKNPGFAGMLGKGRLNVFNALTQSSPSIRNQKLTISSSGSAQGDTIIFYVDLKNFLDPANGLNVTLTSSSAFVKVLTSSINVGNIGTLQTQTQVGPFKVLVLPSAPDNSLAQIRLNYNANGNAYNDGEGFTIPVGLDYINVTVNNIGTTLTSTGRVGYNNADATNGLGFLYKNQNYMYEASLMIGNSPIAVSNNARNGNNTDEHFVKRVRAKRLTNTTADFEGASEFDDSGNPKSLGLYIKHRQVAYANTPDDKYSIVEYEVFNKGTTDLRNLFIGMFTDWDVDANGQDITKYDPFNKLAYVSGKSGSTKYVGVKLLTNTAAPLYYPLSSAIPDNLLYTGFNISQKYQALSSGVKSLSLGDNNKGYDVSFVSGYGPYIIPTNASVKVAFAFLAGDDLNDLEKSAQAAQDKYLKLAPDDVPAADVLLKQNYPNPVQNTTRIQFSIPSQGLTTLDLFDIQGRKIKTLMTGNLLGGSYSVNMDAGNLQAGIYIYRLHFDAVERTLKMIVVK
ncbi:MAG: S8 family serine peptidase [Mucilaginibacter sp.]